MWKKVPFLGIIIFLLAPLLGAQELRINEFMAVPLSGEAEWVELVNAGPSPVPLDGLRIEDRSGNSATIEGTGAALAPGALLLLTDAWPPGSRWSVPADSTVVLSSLPSLNNSGDDIILRDASGRRLDSLHYTTSWLGDKGVSVERRAVDGPSEKENWSVCAADSGATPCMPNSTTRPPPAVLDAGTLRINEIMYDPLPEGCEWIEVYHAGSDSVELSGLQFAVSAGSGWSVIELGSGLPRIAAGELAVIAADSSVLLRFPSLAESAASTRLCILGRTSLGLGNDGDVILLRGPAGSLQDSLHYDPSMHHPLVSDTRGRSLERLHPTAAANAQQSWNSCTAAGGGTPGRENSVYTTGMAGGQEDYALHIAPVPFSPDGDGHEDFCTISCSAPAAVHQVRLRLFDIRGRLVRTLLNNAPMSARLVVVCDGLDEQGRRARVGPYVALLDALDTADNAVAAAKGIVVVAR